MTTFELKIFCSTGMFYEGPCESMILPTEEGLYGIQANHETVAVGIRFGELQYKVDGQWNNVVCGRGYAKMADNEAVLVVDSVERPEDVDENRAREAAERAKERLQVQQSRREYYRGQFAMTRAMTRLKAKERKYS